MKLNCERTNCATGVKTIETHVASVKFGACNEFWVCISPGITGYESCSINDLLRENKKWNTEGWHACSGTMGSWDSLFVPEPELSKLKDTLRLLQPLLEQLKPIMAEFNRPKV